jgi:UMF1 family MFS transporter
MLLFFFSNGDMVIYALLFMMLATIGYSGSIVFYNSYLPAIANENIQDKVSARGYAFGYLGATTLLIFNLIAILNQKALGVTDDTLLPRISFLLTGLWWIGFAQITFRKLPRGIYRKKATTTNYFLNGYTQLIKIWKRLKSEKKLRIFLLSFFFYIMGVQTVMFMAASFGEKEIHLTMMQLIITILLLEYIGIIGAFLFAWISDKLNNVIALIIAVSIWVLICLFSYFIMTPLHFYIAGFFIGMVMGGVQSLSRSTYSKFIPKTDNNAGYFSLYDVCEKLAMMSGLIMWGYLDNLTGSMRNSIIALGLWFFIGLIFLTWVQRLHSKETAATSVA